MELIPVCLAEGIFNQPLFYARNYGMINVRGIFCLDCRIEYFIYYFIKLLGLFS